MFSLKNTVAKGGRIGIPGTTGSRDAERLRTRPPHELLIRSRTRWVLRSDGVDLPGDHACRSFDAVDINADRLVRSDSLLHY